MRAFAQWLNFSPAQLSQMLSGKRTVTPQSLKKIMDKLGLSPYEKSQLLEMLLKGKMNEAPANNQKIRLEEDRFRLIADWYHMAILSLTKV